MEENEGRTSGLLRGEFLRLGTLGIAGAALLASGCDADPSPRPAPKPLPKLSPGGPAGRVMPLNTGWRFGEFVSGSDQPEFKDKGLAKVPLPHCVTDLSWRGWNPESWERIWIYRLRFDAPSELSNLRFFVDYEGILTGAKTYLNGHDVGEHLGGYVPFSYEVTGKLKPRDNLLVVVVDSRRGLNVPPNRPRHTSP